MVLLNCISTLKLNPQIALLRANKCCNITSDATINISSGGHRHTFKQIFQKFNRTLRILENEQLSHGQNFVSFWVLQQL